MLNHRLVGTGIALRNKHFSELLDQQVAIPWLEVLADQYLGSRGVLFDKLQAIAARYPCSLHAVSMSVGGFDPINVEYLEQIKEIAEKINAQVISDHLCWSTLDGQYSHDLLPLVYSQQLVDHISKRVDFIQGFLQKPFMLENISHYINNPKNYLLEPKVLNSISENTGCGILLDVNNIYVSCFNMGLDPMAYVEQINPSHVKQFHLAGFTKENTRLIDSHGEKISDEVWRFFEKVISFVGVKPACVEWDSQIPSLASLLQEAEKSENIMASFSERKKFIEKKQSLPCLKNDLRGIQELLWESIHQSKCLEGSAESVHKNSMKMQRFLSLSQIYPCCQKILGYDDFYSRAMRYFSENASTSPDIANDALGFQEYLKKDELPFLYDLSCYENCWYDVFHSENNAKIKLNELSHTLLSKGDGMALRFVSGLKVFKTSYNVLSIWQSCQDEYAGPSVNVEKGCFYYAMHQRNGLVRTAVLSLPQQLSLKAVENNILLDEWCEACQFLEGFQPEFVGFFYQHGLVEVV